MISERLRAVRRRADDPSLALFVVGCSTGGPDVLRGIIPKLPADFPVPVLIVQHMPAGYVVRLARALDRVSSVKVGLAGHRTALAPGEVRLAPAGRHVGVRYRTRSALEAVLSDGLPVNGCRPAIDPLAFSAAKVVGGATALLVLTGMGSDGCAGARRIRSVGGTVIAQDAATSRVYGMPRAVVDNELAHHVLGVDDIAPFMIAQAERNVRS